MLDTNVLSGIDTERDGWQRIVAKIMLYGQHRCVISAITWHELRYGIASGGGKLKKSTIALLDQVHARFEAMPFGEPAAAQAAIASISTQALAGTGALHLCIPAAMSRQLNLAAERMHRVTLADGRSVEAPYVGPVRVEVAGRTCFAGAMVFGDEVLPGAIPMEDLDLLVDPAQQELVPRDPRGPVSMAKGFAAQ